jgi:phosphopantothenoylcysteine decarboxylase/phosphopantothenate--cysteine ligase
MKILLGVSGSISAYKSLDLARSLINSGHEVKVILTNGALQFVVPQVFSYLGAKAVYLSEDDFIHKNVLHIELSRWCDQLLIAPLSANTLARLARGEASDLLSSVFLSVTNDKMINVFPAMNTNMLHHPFTEENFKQLTKIKTLKNVFICETETGLLACGDIGDGKLPAVDEINEIAPLLNTNIKNKKIVISTGATVAPLDPVRFLTNSSSGLTGFTLASEFLKLGFEVSVIAGIHATDKLNLLKKHPRFNLVRTGTVAQMSEAIHSRLVGAHLYVGAAAISDIEFQALNHKLKKDVMSDSLKILPATDILKSIIEKKYPYLKIVGFAAETELTDEVLLKKFISKPVDLLIGTKVNNGIQKGNSAEGFNNSEAYYCIMEKNKIIFEGTLKKQNLAEKILDRIKL